MICRYFSLIYMIVMHYSIQIPNQNEPGGAPNQINDEIEN
jgi:hypothetical protein